jgi:coenzyme PQQ precursor peptide PqqA
VSDGSIQSALLYTAPVAGRSVGPKRRRFQAQLMAPAAILESDLTFILFYVAGRPLAAYSWRIGPIFTGVGCSAVRRVSQESGRSRTLRITRECGGNVIRGGEQMIWTKPEFKEVAVTLEVTAYAARR